MQPEVLSKDEFIVLKEEGDKTDGDVLEEVVQAESFIWKDPLMSPTPF